MGTLFLKINNRECYIRYDFTETMNKGIDTLTRKGTQHD